MDLIALTVKGITYSQTQNGAYALIMGNHEDERKLPIVIGSFEAQSIAISLEKNLTPPRPLTHDLMISFLLEEEYTIDKIVIDDLSEGIFYSFIHFTKDGREIRLDSRTSDAVALILRTENSNRIFVRRKVLDVAGVEIKDSEINTQTSSSVTTTDEKTINKEDSSHSIDDLKTSELQSLLEKALEKEDYELAAKIRDELERRI